jgi:hypothetical protein
LTNAVPDTVPDAQVQSGARTALLKHLEDRLKGAAGQMGLGVARGQGRFAAVVLSGNPRAVFSGFSPVFSGNSVTLEGKLLGGAEFVVGFANQGPYAVARCEIDARTALPAFRVTCPVAAEDQVARIEIATKQPERVLFESVAQLEVRREGSNPEYAAGAYGSNRAVATSAEFRTSLLTDLNKVRTAAGLPPFALEVQQSATDERLARHLYKAFREGDNQQLNTITLGLLAGWDVRGGLIRNGGVFSRTVNTARNPSRWLTQALSSPLGRWVLLEPNMSRIGIGSTQLEPAGEMALVTTYAFFGKENHDADEVTVLTELNRLRKTRGVAPLRRVESDSNMKQALAQVSTNSLGSMKALQGLLQQTVEYTGSGVQGFVVETNDVKLMKWDPVLTDSSTLDVEVGVTHYRAPGAAWGQYVVYFVVLGHGQPVREARSNAAPSQL